MNIPCLFITYNRLEYTKKALKALVPSDCGLITVIDNFSTDGTQEYLASNNGYELILNNKKYVIAYAINKFLALTKDYEFVAKVDCDTVVPPNWCNIMVDKMIRRNIDILQAKHYIIPATHPQGWEGFIKTCKQDAVDKSIYYNHFVGGSGIVFRRDKVNHIPDTGNLIMGWREWQRQHPEIRKAFCEDVTIELLDSHGYTDFPEYYKQTGRL